MIFQYAKGLFNTKLNEHEKPKMSDISSFLLSDNNNVYLLIIIVKNITKLNCSRVYTMAFVH